MSALRKRLARWLAPKPIVADPSPNHEAVVLLRKEGIVSAAAGVTLSTKALSEAISKAFRTGRRP